MNRIAEAIARTLFEARIALVNNLGEDEGDIDACVILAHAEIAVRLENSQN